MATSTTNISLTLPVIADTTNVVDDFNSNMNIIDGRFSATYMAVQAKNAVAITGGSITGITDLVVADGGTGVSTLIDGGVLLGSGTGAITAMAVLTDGQMIVGNGTTDPVAESGATLRTSIGCAAMALSNLASVAINTSLLSDTADTDSLGSTAKEWLNLYIGDAGKIYIGLGQDLSIYRSAANTMTLTASSGVTVTGTLTAPFLKVYRVSESTALNASWLQISSTVATGDLTGLRTVMTSDAASGGDAATGVNVRGVYGQAICTANKHAGLLQGGLFTAGAAAGTVYNVHVLCGHYSSGGATTIGGDLYVGYLRAQTRESGRSVTGNDCLLALENEAVSGTGQIMDSAIRIFDTNMGVDGFTYGIDMSSADITTADIRLQNGETISNTTDGTITFGAANLTTTGSINGASLTLDTALAIAEGGTNSTTALNNDRVMVSNSGAIAESATITVTELGLLNGVTGTLVTTTISTLSSLTSIGTIATGTWEATDIGLAYGGTGVSTGAMVNFTSILNAALYVGRDADNQIKFATDNNIVFRLAGADGALFNSTGELDMNAHSVGFTLQTATGDGTTTIDWRLGNHFKFTFGAQADTLTFTAPTNPCHLTLIVVQDGTGGRDLTFPVTVKWLGTEPTWTNGGADKTIIMAMVYDGTNYWSLGTSWES